MKVFKDQETSVKEVLAFHGTKRANPKLILTSKEGFDIAFSRRTGLKYGRGIYFAKSFEYSLSYSFVNEDGTKTLFLAKVQIGNTFAPEISTSAVASPLVAPR
jgi:hypothetical protein